MVKWIVIALLGLIILGYLGFDIRKAVEALTTQSNLEYAKQAVSHVWNKFLEKPVKYIWREVIIKYIWQPAIQKLNENSLPEMELNTAGE